MFHLLPSISTTNSRLHSPQLNIVIILHTCRRFMVAQMDTRRTEQDVEDRTKDEPAMNSTKTKQKQAAVTDFFKADRNKRLRPSI